MLDTVITWQLAAEGQGTKLTLIHEGFNLATPMGKQAFHGMEGGWPDVLKRKVAVL